jgi:RNA polymerase sigma factor (sigma-70 family)
MEAPGRRAELLYYFCRLQLPAVTLSSDSCRRHLERTFGLAGRKDPAPPSWEQYLDNLYPLDWFLAAACLDGNARAWEHLFAARAGRSDCLLTDALRARAARLYPRDDEQQDSAVQEFWSQLYVPERAGSLPILGRYDGQRPLVPWLIRVFQNWHISLLRKHSRTQALIDDDQLLLPLPEAETDGRWRELFAETAAELLGTMDDGELLLLGLRFRFHLSQREIAQLLKVHEGTISRRTDQLSKHFQEHVSSRLVERGWTGEDVFGFIRTEMPGLLLDHPRLAVDQLARILAKSGKRLPSLPA